MIHFHRRRQIERLFRDREPAQAPAPENLLAHLWTCDSCRELYERHLAFEAALPDGASTAADRLWRNIQQSAAVAVASAPASPKRPFYLALALAGAAALLLLAHPSETLHTSSAPVSRGDPLSGASVTPALYLYRSVGENRTERVRDRIHADDGLLFAYSNAGHSLSFLAVLAIDSRRAIHWYYPARDEARGVARAVPIRTEAHGVEMGEEIRQALAPGPMKVFGVFLPGPTPTDEIERWLRASLPSVRGPLAAPPISGSVEIVLDLEVVP